MKNIFTLFILFLFYNCGLNPTVKVNQSNKQSQLIRLKEARDKQCRSNTKSDTIFLGFSFGMDEREFSYHLNGLIKNSSLIPINANMFQCKKIAYEYLFKIINFENEIVDFNTYCVISPKFLNENLYELSLFFWNDKWIYDIARNEHFHEIINTYYKKYGEYYDVYGSKNDFLATIDNQYFFVKNNLEIQITYKNLVIAFPDKLIRWENSNHKIYVPGKEWVPLSFESGVEIIYKDHIIFDANKREIDEQEKNHLLREEQIKNNQLEEKNKNNENKIHDI